MVSALRKAGAWVAYRLIRASWWIRRPVLLGVRVLVVDGDRVLLLKHSYKDGWFLPGGTPESGESLAAAGRREVREETGISISNVVLLGIYSSLAGPESDHVVVFRGEIPDAGVHQETHSQNPEVEAVQWTPAEQLPRRTAEQTRMILRDRQEGGNSIYRVINETEDSEAHRPENNVHSNSFSRL